jgi:hypothetical protein
MNSHESELDNVESERNDVRVNSTASRVNIATLFIFGIAAGTFRCECFRDEITALPENPVSTAHLRYNQGGHHEAAQIGN